jgi:anti-anti-sigma regulatory factor/HAMP domain-containing protein
VISARSLVGLVRGRLSSKILLSISAILFVLLIAVAVLTFVEMRRAALAEQQGLADVLNYTFEILLNRDTLPSLQRVTENGATLPQVKRIVIVDRRQKVLASSERLELGEASGSRLIGEYFREGRFERTSRQIGADFVILQPLRGSWSVGGAAGDVVGAAEITLSMRVIEAAARASALRFLAISLGSYVVLAVVLSLALKTLVTGPVQKLALTARRLRAGDRALRSGIRREDEIGVLATAFDEMADEIAQVLEGLEGQVASRTRELEAQRSELERALEELQTSTEARLALADTVKQLSTPVIKVYDRVIVMPLIGTIDGERAALIESSLLAGIVAHRASVVLLDLTGVAVVDAAIASYLLCTTRAAQLLGVSVALVGISARVAKSMVDLDVDLSRVATHADLQSGLLHALRTLGLGGARALGA